MNIRETYALELQSILSDIDALKNKRIYEIGQVPGVASCATIGDRLEKNLAALLIKIEQDAAGDLEKFASFVQNLE